MIRVLKNEEKQHRKMNEEGREGTEWNLREGKNRITEWRERECVRLGFFRVEDVSVKSLVSLI